MKTHFWLIFILIFVYSAFSQKPLSCLKVTVSSSSHQVDSGQTITFAALIEDSSFKGEYKWSVNKGTITGGQGTDFILVALGNYDNGEIIATLELTGLPKNCQSIFSETSLLTITSDPAGIDDYEKISFTEEKKHLKYIVEQLQKYKDSRVVFIFTISSADSVSRLKVRTRNILKYLTETLKFPKNNIAFVRGRFDADSYHTRVYMMPAEAGQTSLEIGAQNREKFLDGEIPQRKIEKNTGRSN